MARKRKDAGQPITQIEVIGSKINFEGSDIIVAREIRKEDKTLTLRNKQGIPAWARSGWNY